MRPGAVGVQLAAVHREPATLFKISGRAAVDYRDSSRITQLLASHVTNFVLVSAKAGASGDLGGGIPVCG